MKHPPTLAPLAAPQGAGTPVAALDERQAITASPELPRGADGPVFRAPWEAQAFALALALHERGAFTWTEWTQTLAAVIGEVRQRGEPDAGDEYYRHWLTALERIASAKHLASAEALSRRRREWEEAARRTPHGQPIELALRAKSAHDSRNV
jgi:nitrile hydratase accessory protein